MYGFFSILVICATIIYICRTYPAQFRIIHEYVQPELPEPELTKEDEEDMEDYKNQMGELLQSVQHATSLMHGGGSYDDKK